MTTKITDADRASTNEKDWAATHRVQSHVHPFNALAIAQEFAHHREESVRALEEDKKRLDWLQNDDGKYSEFEWDEDIRIAIDAAMKVSP